MTRILVRSGKRPTDVLSPEASLARNGWGVFGANVGNLLFTNAVFRAVNVVDSEVVSDSLLTELPGFTDANIGAINDDFDMYVVPLANAFRTDYEGSLRRLTRVIRKLTIPVVVVGVGTQLKHDGSGAGQSNSVKAATAEFVSAVLDHSASIGVRGETTAGYLDQLGFGSEVVRVIGCPSLFDDGRDLSVEKKRDQLDWRAPVTLNLTPSAHGAAEIVDEAYRTFADLTYVPQEYRELAMMIWGVDASRTGDKRLPLHVKHPLFVENRMRFFVDPAPWKRYLSSRDFVYGTRIHGNIAALAAGTPAVLLSHDSRTLELARYHSIPHQVLKDVEDMPSPHELYEESDFTSFNRSQPENFDRYVGFLRENGVPNVHNPGCQNPAYVKQLQDSEYPQGVESGREGEAWERSVDARLRWLWQGADTDKNRHGDGAYAPAFPSGNPAALDEQVRRLRGTVRRLIARVDELESGSDG